MTTLGRSGPRGGKRSLKDALSEAGFGEAPTLRRRAPRIDDERDDPPVLPPPETVNGIARLAMDGAGEPREPAVVSRTAPHVRTEAPLMRQVPQTSSVVSPPPWLRAARRGRRRARMLNTFGWIMTIFVAGSIIGLAGRYLAVAPTAGVHLEARQ